MREDPRGLDSSAGEPGLFDLPLEPPPSMAAEPPVHEHAVHPATPEPLPPAPEADFEGSPRRRAARAPARPETLPLFDFEPTEGQDDQRARREESLRARVEDLARTPRPGPVALPSPSPRAKGGETSAAGSTPDVASLGARLRSNGGDLVVVAAVGAFAALGAVRLGAPIGADQLLPLGLFLLAWSFVYFVVPLAFWGQTPGMSWAGLVARTTGREPLSFGQAALRWLGAWLTWATAGLGGLLALSGRSLADRISGSATFPLASS